MRKTVPARDLWNLICESAWASGEPGLVFIDRYNKESNTWYYEKIICVNPSGEQGLPEWGVCNLGAINLSAFVTGGDAESAGDFDYAALADATRVSMRFLDNVVDATEYFFEENAQAQLAHPAHRAGHHGPGRRPDQAARPLRLGRERAGGRAHLPHHPRRRLRRPRPTSPPRRAPFPMFDREKYLQGRFIQRLPERGPGEDRRARASATPCC